MTTKIDAALFTKIVALPKKERLDLFEFIGSASVGPIQFGKIINDLTSHPVDPG